MGENHISKASSFAGELLFLLENNCKPYPSAARFPETDVKSLKDFFNKKPNSSFKFIFKGKETPEGSFAIGNYVSKGESFRVTIQFKKNGIDFKIESLTIEKA